MKKSQLKFLLSIIGFVGLISSCKQKEVDPIYDTNWSNMHVNGQEWKGQYNSVNIVEDTTLFFNFSKGFFYEGRFISKESFSFHAIPKKYGKVLLKPAFYPNLDSMTKAEILSIPVVNFNTFYQDGELFCENFRLDTTDAANNWIEITHQEDNFNRVWGTFSATFIKTSECDEPKYPGEDTLRIRNGTFYTELKK